MGSLHDEEHLLSAQYPLVLVVGAPGVRGTGEGQEGAILSHQALSVFLSRSPVVR